MRYRFAMTVPEMRAPEASVAGGGLVSPLLILVGVSSDEGGEGRRLVSAVSSAEFQPQDKQIS